MKSRTLILIAIVIVATTLLGNSIIHYIGIQDTGSVEKGMSFTEYTQLIPDEERLDFSNYSYFLNDFNYPVMIRYVDNEIVQMQVIDPSDVAVKQEIFEKITAGMSLSEVSRMVGVPVGISKTDSQTLVYNVRNETMFLIRYTLRDDVQYVESVTAVDLEQEN
jgi:hypothetical protein